jgi:hypothetical protein
LSAIKQKMADCRLNMTVNLMTYACLFAVRLRARHIIQTKVQQS